MLPKITTFLRESLKNHQKLSDLDIVDGFKIAILCGFLKFGHLGIPTPVKPPDKFLGHPPPYYRVNF